MLVLSQRAASGIQAAADSSWCAKVGVRTTSLVWLLMAFQTLPYVPSPSCFTTLYLFARKPMKRSWSCCLDYVQRM